MIPLVTGLLWQNNRFGWTNRPWRMPGSLESAPVPPGSVLWKDLFQYGDTSGNILGLVILNEMLILTDCLNYGSLCARVASSRYAHVELKPKNNWKNVSKNNIFIIAALWYLIDPYNNITGEKCNFRLEMTCCKRHCCSLDSLQMWESLKALISVWRDVKQQAGQHLFNPPPTQTLSELTFLCVGTWTKAIVPSGLSKLFYNQPTIALPLKNRKTLFSFILLILGPQQTM